MVVHFVCDVKKLWNYSERSRTSHPDDTNMERQHEQKHHKIY